MQTNGATLIPQMCVDAATEGIMRAKTDAYMKQHCSKYEKREEGANGSPIPFALSPAQVTGHTITTADGDAAVHIVGTTNADSRWLGFCKLGQRPGVPMMMPGPMAN